MLSAQQKTTFTQRDTLTVEAVFGRLPGYWANNSWLGEKNKYARGGVDQLTKDLTPGKRITHKYLAEYIAASSVTHCLDGWAYFGRSLNAILSGDHNCARHLGYYAELRAAMAFLAAEGIGVFDREHITVSSSGKCIKFPPNRTNPNKPNGTGTHGFVWDALTEWANSQNSFSSLSSMIIAGGQPLTEWLRHFGAVPALTQKLAGDWMLSWGLDISRLAADRQARNIASYRPTAFSGAPAPTAKDAIEAVNQAWQSCQPHPGNTFAVLDRLLVRVAIREAFRASHKQSHKQAKNIFQLKVQSILAGVQPNDYKYFDWEGFLVNASVINPFDPLVLAGGKAAPSQSIHCLQVVFRALLLLRTATGAAKRLLSTLPAGSISQLDFWVESLGTESGLWAPAEKPAQTSDLWLDIENSLTDLMGNLGSIDSYNKLSRSYSTQVAALSSCKRIGIWGVGL